MVGAAVASAFGFGEQPGRSPADTVVAKLAGAEVLLVLDNCEHLLDGVSALVERLLAACPRRRRAGHQPGPAAGALRVRVPRARHVARATPGRTRTERRDRAVLRAGAMTGWTSPYPDDRRRIATVCRRLDGVALAIELAAARVATLGLDGLGRGLADPLGLLTGGSRMDQRHRSVRAVLDWSFGLLSTDEQAAMRRASVFASPFTAAAAAEVAGFAPLTTTTVAQALASLAEHNLVVVVDRTLRAPATGCWRPIRQYGAELMDRDGEQDDVRARHLRWCLATATRLLSAGRRPPRGSTRWPTTCGPGCGWAAGRPAWRAEAHQLAVRLAELTYARGMLSEAQERYEEAAALAADPAEAAQALHLAAAVAWGRHAGNEAIRLYRAAAEAARRAGDPRRAALELVERGRADHERTGHHVRAGAARRGAGPAGGGSGAGGGDAHVEAAVLTVTTAGRTSSTRRTPTWPNAPSSWPSGSATPAWRATRSTS